MTYPDREVAAVAWAADAELRALHGDPVPSLPGDAGDADAHGVTLAGIRAILGGATPEQLHEMWARAREAQGWKRGPRPDSRARTHPYLVPYAELPECQRTRDAVLTAIVRAMSGQDAAQYDGRHPDGCRCQFCREDEREEQAREDRDSADEDDFAGRPRDSMEDGE